MTELLTPRLRLRPWRAEDRARLQPMLQAAIAQLVG